MKYIILQSEGAGIGNGLLKRWAGCALGLVLFLSAAGSVALAQSGAMTQQQYLQWMVGVCGDRLDTAATGDDLINWARGKGMTPAGGWQLDAKLTKAVLAQTLVQLLNLAPRKGTFDAVRILEREGIIIQSSGDHINLKTFVGLIDTGFIRISPPGLEDHPIPGGPPGRDDDDSRPSPTKRPVTPPDPHGPGGVPPGPPPGVPPGQNNVNKDLRP